MGDGIQRAGRPIRAELPDLAVTFERDHGMTIVGLHGDLDTDTVRKARRALSGLVGNHYGHLVLDLRGLRFMDSSGVALLVATNQVARRTGWSLSVVKAPPQIHRVIELCGLGELLPFMDEPPERSAATVQHADVTSAGTPLTQSAE